MAEVIAGKQFPFLWEGKDKKGNKIKGRGLAKSETGDARRPAAPGRRATQDQEREQSLQERRQGQARGHRDLQPPARHHAGGRHPDGAGLRDRRRRPRQAGDAEADPGHQGRHRGRQRAERGARQAPAVFRRPVREPRRGRRAGRRAGDAARQDRHLQGKDRGAQEEDQEGAVLSGRRAGRGRDRDRHPADLRDPAVREPVQGLRRRPAGLHAVRRSTCRAGAGQGLDAAGRGGRRSCSPLPISTSARGRCGSSSTACRCRSRSSARS